MFQRATAFSFILALGLVLPPQITADDSGPPGRVFQIGVNTQASDEYALFRGYVILRSGNELNEYKWGGSTCPGKDLTDTQRDILAEYAQDQRMCVMPQTKNGQGGNTCLVGFSAWKTPNWRHCRT